MKRNHPPDDPEELNEDQVIIDIKLNEVFSQPPRSTPLNNKGHWVADNKHVKVASAKGIPSELLSYSSDLGYHYLNPFEALYCLESSQLIIYFNELPLSLAEAYQILLDSPNEVRNYSVFQHLNRRGYVCLKPNSIETPLEEHGINERSTKKTSKIDISQNPNLDELGPLFKINSGAPIPIDILMSLKAKGPRDYQSDDDKSSQQNGDLIRRVIFDVYRRETFLKNKPRKYKSGNPDYKLIICDKSLDRPPNIKQLACCYYANAGEKIINKLMFAIVEDDNSIRFNQFKYMESKELELF